MVRKDPESILAHSPEMRMPVIVIHLNIGLALIWVWLSSNFSKSFLSPSLTPPPVLDCWRESAIVAKA